MAEHRDFTLEDILAEQRRARGGQEAPKEEAQAPAAPQEEPAPAEQENTPVEDAEDDFVPPPPPMEMFGAILA